MTRSNLERMLRESRWTFVLGLLAVSVAVGLYFRAGLFDFCTYDDPGYITMNRHVLAKFSWDSVRTAFSLRQVTYWHPLTTLSFMLDHHFYRLWPGGYHMTNVLLHGVNVALFFALILALTKNRFAAVFAALLFAAHPTHVEAVAWISARKDVLSTALGLASMLLYIRWTRKNSPGAAVGMYAACALSLMSKPMFATMPCLLLLLDYWPLERLGNEGGAWPRLRTVIERVREKVLFLAMGVFITVMTITTHPVSHDRLTPDLGLKLANAVTAIAKYLGLLVWPTRMAVIYPFPESVPVAQVLGASALVAAISALCMWQVRRRAYLLVGWLWFLGTLAPVLMPPPVGLHVALADRWTYVPFMGLYLALGCLAAEALAAIARPAARGAAAVALIVLPLVPLGLAQQRQLSTWRNAATVYEQALRVTTGSYVVMNNYAVLKTSMGQYAEAEAIYQEAHRWYPENGNILIGIGEVRLAQGRPLDALEPFWQAMLLLEKEHAAYNAYRGLARLLIMRGRPREAQDFFALAVRESPSRPEAYVEWAALAKRLGDPDRAREYITKGALAPDTIRPGLTLEGLRNLVGPASAS